MPAPGANMRAWKSCSATAVSLLKIKTLAVPPIPNTFSNDAGLGWHRAMASSVFSGTKENGTPADQRAGTAPSKPTSSGETDKAFAMSVLPGRSPAATGKLGTAKRT
jgi:hypothetical protein